MTKLFVTGATGFIGGDAFYAIANAHPEYEITALVRNSEKGAQVAKEYPNVKLAYGDLDSTDLLEEEAKKADIVCRILLFADIKSGTYGEALDKVYDDLENVSEVTSLPDFAPHRNVDKIVLQAGTEHQDRVKTAIVCPPTIYGPGRGPGNKRSHQVPELARSTLERGAGIKVGAGKTFWGDVHVHDLSDLYLKLPATWGAEGYYFCEGGEHVWGDVSQWVAQEAHKQGLIKSDAVESISREEADKCTPFGAALWGCNSRARAKRARTVLKWDAKSPALHETINSAVEYEASRLGMTPGHAKVVAGEA
ncbi:NAD(P)-binding protein [Hortaea werneckii]|nr:NAD(P)-binding protein [Hortaea werneckii]KAI7025944.1 NAD(P)-binding protein [Hortaea werneckii]KAI7675567.1 NAD(P)-binding protein [Hortaea werneckii]